MSDKQSKYTPKTAWKPGESGNLKGRPKKKYCIPDILTEIGKQKTPEKIERPVKEMFEISDDKKLTNLDVVLYRIYSDALKGKPHAVQFIADRTEGKTLDRVEVEVVETFFDIDKLKGVKDADIRTVIKILRKIRTETGD